MRPFHIFEPDTVEEASRLLGEYGPGAHVYAGGTELLLAMKEGLLEYDALINIKGIPDLDLVEFNPEARALRIGALATHRSLERSPVLRAYVPTLCEVEGNVANLRVRNVGTIGGNLCFAEPHSDPAVMFLLHDAVVHIESQREARTLPLSEFMVDSFEVALEPDEILTHVELPLLPDSSAATYEKFAHLERPSAGVGAALALDASGEAVADVRLAVGSVDSVPKRLGEAEGLLRGLTLEEAKVKLNEAATTAAKLCDPVDDLYGSSDYKRQLVKVLTERVVGRAIATLERDEAA